MIQCKNCLKKLLINAQSCKHCGALVHPIPIEYFYTPPLRFLLLSFITFGTGWYCIYWFYKNWAAVKKAQGIKAMRPFWRAYFLEFFCWSLFNGVYRDASQYGYKYRRAFHLITLFSMGIYSIIYILSILSRIINYTPLSEVLIIFLLIVSLLKIIAILITQRAIKFHNTYAIPGYQARRKLTKGEVVFVVLGCVIWLAAIIKIALG